MPDHSMHWFEPFGSTKFEDICSAPVVSSANPDTSANHNCRRILFWDQEPLSPDAFKTTMLEFRGLYDTGKTFLVTSERDSDFLDYAGKYISSSFYYFFHGWAALDWYRGYDKTFLIKPINQRLPTKTFLAPNRIVGGNRRHRLEMLYHIFKQGLTDNYISCPAVCPAENISIIDAARPLLNIYPDIQDVFGAQQLPINFANESGHPMHSCWLSLFDEAADSLLYLVSETVADGRRHHLTEKTFKPIAMGMPFILVATQGSLEYLRSYGFKTFGHLWDESYDTISDPHQRIQAIASLLENLCNLSIEQRRSLFRDAIPTIRHNWNHFYNGGFEAILWDELQSMLKEIHAESRV